MKVQKDSKVLILSHYYKRSALSGGPPQDIRDYFLPIVKTVVYIEHPFPYSDEHRSSLSIYRDGKLDKQIFTVPIYGPQILHYAMNVIFTIYFYFCAPHKYDLCIALDNLNTFSVLPLKKLNFIKKLIFYTIDYTPLRFKNKLLNLIYHYIDRITCYNSDTIWVLSPRMVQARNKNGIDHKKSAPSIVLPMGANLSRIKRLPVNKINRHQIIFAGILLKKQGVQLILAAMPKIISRIPDVNFIIVGEGEYENELKKLVKDLDIESHVDFKGFVEAHTELEKLLCKSAIGVAPYLPEPENYTMYTDPGKPKLYLGCGLPVIITNVPAIAKEIKKRKAGVIINFNTYSAENALMLLLSNNDYYKESRDNAIELSRKYDTNNLVANALNKT